MTVAFLLRLSLSGQAELRFPRRTPIPTPGMTDMKAGLTALTFAALLVAASPLPGHAAEPAPATPAPAAPAAAPVATPAAPAAPAQALEPRPSIVPPTAAPSSRRAARRRLRHHWRYTHRRHHYRHWAYWRPFRFIGPTSIGAAFPGSASKDASRLTFLERRTSYFPVKCGLRRSRKALIPSFRSSLSRTGSSSLRTSATVSSGPFGMASRASFFSA